MTDFVGWLPMPDGGAGEAALTADYNAEMLEQRARFRRVRDRSIFVGDPDDIVADDFGPGSRRSGSGPSASSTSPATSPASTRWPTTSGRPCAPSSATAPTSGCASSPSAGPASAGTAAAPGPRRGARGARRRRRPAVRGRDRAAHRPRVPALPRGRHPAPLRARPPPTPGRVRHRRRAGRPHHLHGAHRQPAPLRLRAAAPPLRADLPRAPPARPLRRRPLPALRRAGPRLAGRGARRRSSSRPVDYRPVATDGAARAAALLAELL